MSWEVSLVGRNTITHGGCVGPATQEVNVQLLESTGVIYCSVLFGSVVNRKLVVDFLIRLSRNLLIVARFGSVRFGTEVGPEVYCSRCSVIL